MKTFKMLALFVIVVLMMIMGVSGCKDTETSTSTAVEETAESEESTTETAEPEEQQIVLKIWDMYTDVGHGSGGEAMETLIDMYKKANPNVEIERTVIGSENMQDQVSLSMAGGTMADLVETWPACGVLSGYAQDGEVYDMTDKAEEFGWFELMNSYLMLECSTKGRLYGLPWEFDRPVIYYNKTIFEELGLSEPNNYDDFITILDTIKADGKYDPITIGNGNRWPICNLYDEIRAVTVGKEKVSDLFFGDADWDDPEFVEAWTILLDWIEKGYFIDGFNGVKYGDSNSNFIMKNAAISIDGSWILSNLVEAEVEGEFEVGVFPFPMINEDLPPTSLAGSGANWIISSKSAPEVQEEAMNFLNFILSDEAAQIWIDGASVIPGYSDIDWDRFTVDPLMAEVYEINEGKEDTTWSHVTVPESVAETLYSTFQSVAGLTMTPEEALNQIEEDWEEAKAEGRVWNPLQ
ncbi:MAG: extracellular solute-binding protein [Actinomycetota bacterium]|nr:extracellular solute-binding protein [Actinomycetota bacterium]